MIDGELEIPESNREIALHLRSIRQDITQINTRINDFENSATQKKLRFQDFLFSIVGGVVVYLCTQLFPLN